MWRVAWCRPPGQGAVEPVEVVQAAAVAMPVGALQVVQAAVVQVSEASRVPAKGPVQARGLVPAQEQGSALAKVPVWALLARALVEGPRQKHCLPSHPHRQPGCRPWPRPSGSLLGCEGECPPQVRAWGLC